MRTFVSLWNPSGAGWKNLPQLFETLCNTQNVEHPYGVGNRKELPVGSTLYVMRTGTNAGLQAKAISLTPPERRPRLDDPNRMHMQVLARFEYLPKSIDDEPVISRAMLVNDPVTSRGFNWKQLRSGGRELPARIAERVSILWDEICQIKSDHVLDERNNIGAIEGKIIFALSQRRTRERSLRKDKLADCLYKNHGRLICEACGLNLTQVYGGVAESIAEVHHLQALSDGPARNTIDDLAVVCPNCHRYIHTTIPPRLLADCQARLG